MRSSIPRHQTRMNFVRRDMPLVLVVTGCTKRWLFLACRCGLEGYIYMKKGTMTNESNHHLRSLSL